MSRSELSINEQQAEIDLILKRASFSLGQDFGDFLLLRILGLKVSYEREACLVQIPVSAMSMNPQGTLHGGILAIGMDISMGHLLCQDVGPGATLEMKIQYLRPVNSESVMCRGEFIKKGRTISYLQSKVTDVQGRDIAFATATWTMLR